MIFYKLQATGNDFIVLINDLDIELDVKKLCDRHYGIGADGIIIIDKTYNLKIYNSDGSIAKMCGNGLRCVGKLLNYLTNKDKINVFIDNDRLEIYQINENENSILMPTPIMINHDDGYYVNVLNNHYVLLCNDLDKANFNDKLKLLSKEKRCNIHLVEIVNKKLIKIKTYEYGAGETKSCGSGAIAVFFALYMLNKVDNNLTISQNGGNVKCQYKNNHYYLQGTVNLLFKGELIDGI